MTTRGTLITALSVSVLTAMTAVSSARADLVYEENIAPGAAAGGTSGTFTRSQEPPAQAPMQVPTAQAPSTPTSSGVSVPTPVYTGSFNNGGSNMNGGGGSGGEDEDTVSRSELMRRERLREEVKNEDVLQARLEELRLRDEERRTQQILASPGVGTATFAPASAAAPTQVEEQVIVAPATEHPGQPASQPVMQQPVAQQPVQLQQPMQQPEAPPAPGRRDRPELASAASTSMSDSGAAGWNTAAAANPDVGNRSSITVQPRLGLSGMLGNTGYQVDPHFSTGVSVGFNASDHFAVDVGYQYSEFGVALASSNPFVQSIQMMDGFGMDTMTMKQNLVDAGVRYYLLNPDSTIRPFFGAGLGYAKSFINYSQAILSQTYMQGMSPDYGLSQYLGFISAGFDVKVSKNVSLGFLAKYYDVFASTEDGYLNNMAFYNPMAMGGYGWQPGSYDKQYVGGSLAGMNFFSLLGDVTFNF